MAKRESMGEVELKALVAREIALAVSDRAEASRRNSSLPRASQFRHVARIAEARLAGFSCRTAISSTRRPKVTPFSAAIFFSASQKMRSSRRPRREPS